MPTLYPYTHAYGIYLLCFPDRLAVVKLLFGVLTTNVPESARQVAGFSDKKVAMVQMLKILEIDDHIKVLDFGGLTESLVLPPGTSG